MPDPAQTASTSSHIPMCYKDIFNPASLRSSASHSPFPTLLHARVTQTGCILPPRAEPSLGQHTSNHQHNPPRSSTLLGHQCPFKPHGSPPSKPTPLLGREARRSQRVLTAATAPGCSGREALAGCAAGCGSAVCRERRNGQGLRDKAMTPPATQLGASGRAGCFGLLREANRAEHPTWQGHSHAAHHSPRQGQPTGH